LPSKFLGRALSSDFAVRGFFAVRFVQILPCKLSLPCVLLGAHDKEVFVVHGRTAMICCMAAHVFPVVDDATQTSDDFSHVWYFEDLA
jgi:hypothetical protein